ncbi:MAG: response regulator transcription factor [Anaerolineales bacterium]|nr:MAG: response regulator transcription factor [Anaerolineales bacterium]
MSQKVLVVDDDQTLLAFLYDYLNGEGFEVLRADRGQKALRMFFDERPDIVVLDVMMPGMDGWEVCARIRELADTPVILLTAKTSEADKLRGFRMGVDDYITKPFSLAELTARIRAVLGRAPTDEGAVSILNVGDLQVDLRKREVRIRGAVVDLTPTEFRLMAVLAERAGEAISQDSLMSKVWGDNRVKSGSALRRYIWLLRSKIEAEPEVPQRLVTVRGYGYRLER